MSMIQAAQLIFTRVEADYSPKRSSGYQVVYKGQELTNDLVAQIQQRIQCFQLPKEYGRLQYFLLDKLAIVTKTASLTSHTKILDRDGREAFLVHCLLVQLHDFKRLGNNPFCLLDAFEPMNNAEKMVIEWGQATGVLPDRHLEPVEVHAGHPLAADEMLKLITAVQPMRPNDGGQALLYGPAVGIESTLRTLHTLLTPRQRLHCTFDSCLDGCNIPSGIVYWARGYAKRVSGSFAVTVDIEQQQVLIQGKAGGDDLYTTWLKMATVNQPLPVVAKKTEDAFVLAEAFEQRKPLARFDVAAAVARDFVQVHRSFIMEKLQQSIAVWLPPDVSQQVYTLVTESFADDDGQVLNHALSGAAVGKAPANYLSDWVLSGLLMGRVILSQSAVKQVKNLARNGRFPLLLFYVATTSKKVDSKARNEALAAMDVPLFVQALDYLRNPIAPVHYLHQQHIQALLQADGLQQMGSGETAVFLQQLIDKALFSQLALVEALLAQVKRQDLALIEKAARKQKQMPTRFMQAIQTRRQEVGSDSSLFERLKLW